MGPYCKYCDNRCFVHLPQATPQKYLDIYEAAGFTSIIIATCPAGQRAEKNNLGVCYDEIVADIKAQARLKAYVESFFLISDKTAADFRSTANFVAELCNEIQQWQAREFK